MTVSLPQSPTGGRRRGQAAIAVVATGAVACSVCCVLPFALPAAVLASSGGALALFAGFLSWPAIIAIPGVAAAWLWVALQSYRSRQRPASTTIIALGIGTMFMVVGLAWPFIEPAALALVRSR